MTKEALTLALEALKMNPLDTPTDVYDTKYQKAIDVAREALAQQEDRNFCPRCGKRTADLTLVHTCTPPQGNT